MGNSFQMYLRDLRIIEDAHHEAPRVANQDFLTLPHAQPAYIMRNVLMSEGTANANMGKYHNEWTEQHIIY